MAECRVLSPRWLQGFAGGPVGFVDHTTLCFASGCFVRFVDTQSHKWFFFKGPEMGINTLASSAKSNRFAIADCGLHPTIRVFSYPHFQCSSILKGGAELEISFLSFSNTGPYLASFSGLPDFSLCVWDWMNCTLLCCHSLHGVNLLGLTFNPSNWKQLFTIGDRHMSIWSVEQSDNVYLLRSRPVSLPSEDGKEVIDEDLVLPGRHDTMLGLSVPNLPVSARAGLIGEVAKRFVPRNFSKQLLRPCSFCWTSASQLFVGCREGHLLQIDCNGDSFMISPFFPGPPGSEETLQPGHVNALARQKLGLFAGGTDGKLYQLIIQGSEVKVNVCGDVGSSISSLIFREDHEKLAITTERGSIHMYSTLYPGSVEVVLDMHSTAPFISVDTLAPDNTYCIAAKADGEIAVFAMEDGKPIGCSSLGEQVSSLASSRCCQQVVIGTNSGFLYFLNCVNPERPRVVHHEKLFKVPVTFLQFDLDGQVLLAGASLDNQVFVVDGRPSRKFSVIGFMPVTSLLLGVSLLTENSLSWVLLLQSTSEAVSTKGGSQLTRLCLPSSILNDNCANMYGAINEHLLQRCVYELDVPATCAVLGPQSKVYTSFEYGGDIYVYELPKENSTVPVLCPVQRVAGHLAGEAMLCVSPHQQWLLSAASDGLLCIRECSGTMVAFAQERCHSHKHGGVSVLAIAVDGQSVVTAGKRDGTLLCLQWSENIKAKVMEAVTFAQSQQSRLGRDQQALAHTMQDMPEIEEIPQPEGKRETTKTWLQIKEEKAMLEEKKKYQGQTWQLHEDVQKLQEELLQLMDDNTKCPELERLEWSEFFLDPEEWQRLEAEGKHHLKEMEEKVEMDKMSNQYLQHLITKECWDELSVKARSIKAFLSELEVHNYAIKERSDEDLQNLQRVIVQREIEIADKKIQEELIVMQRKEEEVEEEEEGAAQEIKGFAVTGSLSASIGIDSPYLYCQFDLHTREQRMNQMMLLKDVLYKLKTNFNKDFEVVWRQKERAMSRIQEKNKYIREILADLGIQAVESASKPGDLESVWEPEMTEDEVPERVFVVQDWEVEMALSFTAEQKARHEETLKRNDDGKSIAQADNRRLQGLMDMMWGVLELKKENVLKMEIPEPSCMSKPQEEWTVEDHHQMKDFNDQVKELNDKKEKYRNVLQDDLKRMHSAIIEYCQSFDRALTCLFDKKIKIEMAIHQEELKLANLSNSLLLEDELNCREVQLNFMRQQKKQLKEQSAQLLLEAKERVENFRETYSNLVTGDKELERGFRREFPDLQSSVIDNLFKMYKHRPRAQKVRTLALSADPYAERPSSRSGQAREAATQLLQTMAALDKPECSPMELEPPLWEHFCQLRQEKVLSELTVKEKALMLAEMEAFLQNRVAEDEKLKQDINNITQELNSLHEEKARQQVDLVVQFLLKQGQVEIEAGTFVPQYSNCVLLHQSIVEDLNSAIKALIEDKVAGMVKAKDFHKKIVRLEWEHRRQQMEIEDLQQKLRNIQLLKVSRKLQAYLNKPDRQNIASKEISKLEKNIALRQESQQKVMRRQELHCEELSCRIQGRAKEVEMRNTIVQELKINVGEINPLEKSVVVDGGKAAVLKKHYSGILRRRHLLDITKKQAEELAQLRAEAGRLHRKNFISLSSPKY